jgi:hypothetical protein
MQMNVPNSGPSGLPGKLTNTSFDDAADLQSLSRALWVVDGQRVIINYETQLRRRKGKKKKKNAFSVISMLMVRVSGRS